MIKIYNIHVEEEDIYGLTRDKEYILLAPKKKYQAIENIDWTSSNPIRLTIKVKNDYILSELTNFLISRVKRNKDPFDRVCDFEWFPDFDKRDRLIQLRKTVDEKREEINYITRMISDYKEIGLDTLGLREELKEKMRL